MRRLVKRQAAQVPISRWSDDDYNQSSSIYLLCVITQISSRLYLMPDVDFVSLLPVAPIHSINKFVCLVGGRCFNKCHFEYIEYYAVATL